MMSAIKYITFEEELKKNPELKISDINILREWCEEQPHLPKIQDVELAIFLHSNYYQIEPTKSTIENYYTYRTHAPELFSNRDLHQMKQLRDSFNVVAQIYMKGKTKEGYTIIVSRFLDTDPDRFHYNELLNAGFMMYDKLLWTQGSTPGYIIVTDATGPTLRHMRQVNFATMKKSMRYVQEAMPVRLKGFHVINMSPVFETIFKMMRPFMSAELVNMMHFHSTLESASKYFPIEALPNEFGGKAGAIRELADAQFKEIEDFREWFLEDEKNNRVNESLRISKTKTSCSIS